jgi:hypothetical protein
MVAALLVAAAIFFQPEGVRTVATQKPLVVISPEVVGTWGNVQPRSVIAAGRPLKAVLLMRPGFSVVFPPSPHAHANFWSAVFTYFDVCLRSAGQMVAGCRICG